MNFEKFSLGETVAKFFEPFKKRTFWMIIASVIVGLILFVVVNIGFAEVVRQNSYDMHMLAAEQLNELGPCYISESVRHSEMIKQYTKHLEQRQLAALVRVLFPTYSPKKVLASAEKALEKAAKGGQEEAKTAIWKAGVASNQLYMLGKRLSRSPIAWFESEDLPRWLLTDLNNAFVESHELVNKLKSDQTQEAAVEACVANRKTILLLFLARLGYDDQKTIREFLSDVELSYEYTKAVADKEENKETKEEILEVARSEERRVKILEAMLANDMDRVCHLLTEAVERAYEKREAELSE